MSEGKYRHLIITNTQRTDPDPEWYKSEAFRRDVWDKLVFADEEIIPGCNMTDCNWKCTATPEGTGHPEHYHADADELMFRIGTNPENYHDMNGVVEISFEGNPQIFTDAYVVWIPRGVKHGPMYFRSVDDTYPMMGGHIMLGPGAGKYTSEPQT